MSNKYNKPVIIFDFDGTIADSMAFVHDIANKLLPAYGRPQGLTKQDIKKMRGMTIAQALKYVKIPAYKLPGIAIQAKAELADRIEDLEPIKGMLEVIKDLHKNGLELGIVSSNSQDNVTSFLRRHNLKTYFSFVDTGVSIFGKARHIKATIKKQRLSPQDCIYVGDEIRDVMASKALKIRCISVTWGMNDKSALEKENPTLIVDTPKQLKEAIQNI